ncbi:hypothetical protein DXG03_004066 [Asterophora parasitica]|uniref:Uncharacterized protein n=1 Tax=Asterophora parasitica TaxID=117018 RepID=A0A9P7G993_9AGAR|nr:hypothetical protein DXG03_004066 [Asterophora parasitica]
MATKPLDVLKVGLARLKGQIKTRRDDILARLARNECVLDDDEHRLDHDANFVDEDAILELLEKASDYERGLERLNSQLQYAYIADLDDPFAHKLEGGWSKPTFEYGLWTRSQLEQAQE